MQSLFQHYPEKPRNAECQSAHLILCNAHDAASSFLDIFTSARKNRKAKGTPTDEEQDLLRAMLTFASAGLDSTVKQLVSDALPAIIDRDPGAGDMFVRFVERRLTSGEGIDRRFLAGVLAHVEPRNRLLEELVEDLRSGSLQSRDQLLRTASFFNIPSHKISDNPQLLTDIFRARNQIVHEMDIDFEQSNRNRRPRAKSPMTSHTNELFRIGRVFLAEVDQKLTV